MTRKDEPDTEGDYAVITLLTQFRGNRIVSHVYPAHYAKVMLARWTAAKYAEVRSDDR